MNSVINLIPRSNDSPATPPAGARGNAVPGPRVPLLAVEQQSWFKNFFSSLKDFLAERPVKLPPKAGSAGGAFTGEPFGGSFFENMLEWLRPLPASARRRR